MNATNQSKIEGMNDEPIQNPEDSGHSEDSEEKVPTDWAGLRVQAAKLGISLSQLQQLQREQKLRRDRKSQNRPAPKHADTPV